MQQKSDQVANKRRKAPPAFRHVVLTYSGISGDIEGQEASFIFPKRTPTGCVIFRLTENNSDSSFSRWICVVSDLKYLPCRERVVVRHSIENTLIQYMPHTGRELKCPLSSKKALSASTSACVYRGASRVSRCLPGRLNRDAWRLSRHKNIECAGIKSA